jgi:hypothetical protein
MRGGRFHEAQRHSVALADGGVLRMVERWIRSLAQG